MRKLEFLPILLANDLNAYGLARAFHEEYEIKPLLLARRDSGVINYSKIVMYEEVPNLNQTDVFLEKMDELYERYKESNPSMKLILIGCADHYVRLIVENKDHLLDKFIIPHTEKDILEKIVLKESFYELCEKYGLDYPKTFIYTKDTKDDFELEFGYPAILKPSDSVTYWETPFEGQHKVHFPASREELLDLLHKIYRAGYEGNMIIQEMIPGDDEYMHDLHVYVGKDHKVKLMNLGNVLLEEHTPKGIGSDAATISTFDEKLMLKVKEVLEGIGYQGWCDCDIKLDPRDNKFKIFEINIRQGRSHYRVTANGDNVAKYIVDDFVYDKELDLKLVDDPFYWHMIPNSIVFKYVTPEMKAKLKKLIKEGKEANTLYYKKDMSFRRSIKLFLKSLNQHRKYRKYYKK